MKSSEFVFDYVQLLSCKCNEINPNHDGSYIDKIYQIIHWIKNKKTAIHPINKKDQKYCQYAVTVALYQKEIKKIH